jgi:hypothetical protein
MLLLRAVIFMNNILRDPDRIFDYARLYTTSVASTLIYGQRVDNLDSYWFKDFFELMDLVRIPIAYCFIDP